jgi:hypothetical protein
MALNDEELQQLVELLSQLEVGKLPLPVFHQLARLMVLPAVEVIPLRLDDAGQPWVLLTQRDKDDPIWPLQWHTPGRILRPSDVDGSGTYATAIHNLVEAEFPGVMQGEVRFVEIEFRTVARGAESAALHWMEVGKDAPQAGEFFRVAELPPNTIEHHGPMIRKVTSHYLAARGVTAAGA